MSSSGMPYPRGPSTGDEEGSNPENQFGNPTHFTQQHQQQQQQQQQHQHQMPPAVQHQTMFYNPQMTSQSLSTPYSPSFSQPSSSSSPLHGGISRFPTMVHPSASVTGMPGNMTSIIRRSPVRTASSSSLSSKSPRARVNMACVHCRSRKIRCDGNQPMCATCTRLGRVCHYENISEEENAAVRDRKRRSREARQARLDAISHLGVPMPRGTSFLERRRTFNNAENSPYGSTMTSSSVLRDSRISSNPTMIERQPFYPATQTGNRQDMVPPPLPAPNAGQQTGRTWQSQVPTAQYLPPPSQSQQRSGVPSHYTLPTRKRGATVGGFETGENEQQEGVWREGQMGTGSTSMESNMNLYQGANLEPYPSSRGNTGSLYDVIAPPMTSLSQPTTPQGTYNFHANMLSNDLAATSGSSTGQQSPQTSPFLTDSFQNYAHSTLPSSSSSGNTENQTNEHNPNTVPSMPALASTVSDDTMYAGSLYMGRSEPYSNSVTVSQTNKVSQVQNDNQSWNAQGEGQSQDVDSTELTQSQRENMNTNRKEIWRRTTNSDAAIARFFARVVAARDGDSDNSDLAICGPGGFNILAWSQNTNLLSNQDNSISSSNSNSYSGQEAAGNVQKLENGSGMNYGLQNVAEGISTSAGLILPDTFSGTADQNSIISARRTSELSLLSQISQHSQASVVPGTTVTTPSESGGFRSHRPPPLRFDSLPTFVQQQQQQQAQQERTNFDIYSSDPQFTTMRANSDGLIQAQTHSNLLTPMNLPDPVIIHSPANLTPNISPGATNNSPSLTFSPSVDPQQNIQHRQITTPITELSSHLLSLGHSTQEFETEENPLSENQ